MRISKAISRVCWGGCLLGVAVFASRPAMGQEAPTHEERLQEGIDAFWRNEPASYAMLLPLAEGGDPVAQHAIGCFFMEGAHGHPKDHATAAAWFKKSAEQGLAQGQLYYASMLEEGYGAWVPHGLYPVMKGWFHKQAMQWYLKAAEQNFSSAQWALGCAYEEGRLVPQDWIRAYMWFTLAVEQGSPVAQTNQNVLKYRLTAEEIAQAVALAHDWAPPSAPVSTPSP